ncbi:hypothetical protein MLD38_012404 [Melastoma candidum]|uniref:Uncharacterized protein n=1 Tax=Melastoma candidum TaxID=119954 RepID=A0ACB9RAE1_9MYRT|nr:hypothetical protein MLD38_012404 [Melastoma candidum]
MPSYVPGSGCKELVGLSLDDVLGNESKSLLPPTPASLSRTPSQIRRSLWDVIREQEREKNRDRKAWKRFKDQLRLHHASATRKRRVEVPLSDIPLRNSGVSSSYTKKRGYHKGSALDKFAKDLHIMAEEDYGRVDDDQVCDVNSRSCSRPGMMLRTSFRHGAPVQEPSESDELITGGTPEKASLQPQMMRRNSTKMGSMRRDDPDFISYGGEFGRSSRRILPTSTDDRQISAREAAASQEASEAETAAASEEEQSEGLFVQEMTGDLQPLRMSLMDLLEETDRQMGYTGSSYTSGEEDDDDEEDEKHKEEAAERSCSGCQVKHKGDSLGSCRHSFCKLCSKELQVCNGNCPACNDFNLEIVVVF